MEITKQFTDRERYRQHENGVYKELILSEKDDRCSECGILMTAYGRKLNFDAEGNFVYSTHGDC